jgi:hypothetical protein
MHKTMIFLGYPWHQRTALRRIVSHRRWRWRGLPWKQRDSLQPAALRALLRLTGETLRRFHVLPALAAFEVDHAGARISFLALKYARHSTGAPACLNDPKKGTGFVATDSLGCTWPRQLRRL